MYISGGIPEFAKGFGVEYELVNIENVLNTVIAKYDYFEQMKNYPFNSMKMSEEYLILFEKLLVKNKKEKN